MSVRWRIDLAYEGTNFSGWASQRALRTVQGELEHWITTVLRRTEQVRLTVAGRTDAGVHARGQVAHFDLLDDEDASQLTHRLRRVLPPDIWIQSINPAPPGFDARFSAIWRRYIYRLWDADSVPDPLLRRHVTRVRDRLDVEAMDSAADLLVGLRDFAPFCKHREGATTIRQLTELSVSRHADPNGTIVCVVQSDAFCHSMVRSLVGALCAVGSGLRDVEWLGAAAAKTSRASDVHVIAPDGLCLERVGYPPDGELADRAKAARAVRVLEMSPQPSPTPAESDPAESEQP